MKRKEVEKGRKVVVMKLEKFSDDNDPVMMPCSKR
jgi:hypothetical protein